MKRILIIKLVVMFVAQPTLYSQSNDHLPDLKFANILPPSPTSNSIIKYLDFPLENFTGQPRVSISLPAIESRRLSVPVSINYLSGGVKVDQDDGLIGLGWILNTGNIVTREVKGLPDDIINGASCPVESFGSCTCIDVGWGYLFTRGRMMNIVNKDNFLNYFFSTNDYKTSLNGEVNNSARLLLTATRGQLDTEPDVFTFSAGSQSGKFFIYNDTICDDIPYLNPRIVKVVLCPYQDIQIKPCFQTNNEISGFSIRLQNGDTYYYTIAERTRYIVQDAIAFEYNTSWQLSKIISADGKDSILFNYTESYETAFLKSFQKKYRIQGFGVSIQPGHDLYSCSCHDNDECAAGLKAVDDKYDCDYHISYISLYHKVKRLTSVVTLTDSINFSYNLNGRYGASTLTDRINNISYYNRQSKEKFSNIDFGNSYLFQNTPILNLNTFCDIPRKKLKFLIINEKKYSFEYFVNEEDPVNFTLPSRFSPGFDHWGYFNNANGNDFASRDKYVGRFYYPNPQTNVLMNYGGISNKEPSNDVNIVQTGSLRKVIYPTGGWTQFEYELNNVTINNQPELYGGLRLKSLGIFDPLQNKTIVKSYQYSDPKIFDEEPVYGSITKRIVNQYMCQTFNEAIYADVFEKSLKDVCSFNGASVVYNKVTEYYAANNSNINGHCIYTYRFDNVFSRTGNIDPYFNYYNPENNKYNFLKKLAKYDAQNTMLYEEQNEYLDYMINSNGQLNILPYDAQGGDYENNVCGFKLFFNEEELAVFCGLNTCVLGGCNGRGFYIGLKAYKIYNRGTLISSKTINDRGYISTHHYNYDGLSLATNRHQNVTLEEVDYPNSNYKIVSKYPSDFIEIPSGFSFIQSAIGKGVTNIPIQRQFWKNDKLVGAVIMKYHNLFLMPCYYYKLNLDNPLALSLDSYPYSTLDMTNYTCEKSWKYDKNNGNLIQEDSKDGITRSYLWGYQYTLPVAQVIGGTYSEDSGKVVHSKLQLNNDNDINEEFKKLRAGWTKPVQITTCLYRPSCGIKTITGPDKMSTYYNYYNNKDLKSIFNAKHEQIKLFEYKYQNQK